MSGETNNNNRAYEYIVREKSLRAYVFFAVVVIESGAKLSAINGNRIKVDLNSVKIIYIHIY